MHACAAGGGTVTSGVRWSAAHSTAYQLLAVDRTHAGAEELEVARQALPAGRRGRADDEGLRLAGLALRLLELLVVGTSAIVKAERIFRPDVSVQLDE